MDTTMENQEIEKLKQAIRDVPDFPKEGILFKDISTLVKDPVHFKKSVDLMLEQVAHKEIDVIVGVEARGFIFGAIMAERLGAGFVPLRKKGKLPYETVEVTYDLEYGQDTLAVHEDAFDSHKNVLIVDDLLATGGTLVGACQLVEKTGAKVQAISTLVELSFLNGRDKLSSYDVYALIQY